MTKLYLNIKEQRDDLDKLFEKLNSFLDNKFNIDSNNTNISFKQISTPTEAARFNISFKLQMKLEKFFLMMMLTQWLKVFY